jgi:hypothetical protein
LGRSLRHRIEVAPTLAQCGVGFKGLHAPLEIVWTPDERCRGPWVAGRRRDVARLAPASPLPQRGQGATPAARRCRT